jgi:hypothetical protein
MTGFAESGEGFNAEWPFNRPGGPKLAQVILLERAFEKAWTEFIAGKVG